jgi:hypothetical protein
MRFDFYKTPKFDNRIDFREFTFQYILAPATVISPNSLLSDDSQFIYAPVHEINYPYITKEKRNEI